MSLYQRVATCFAQKTGLAYLLRTQRCCIALASLLPFQLTSATQLLTIGENSGKHILQPQAHTDIRLSANEKRQLSKIAVGVIARGPNASIFLAKATLNAKDEPVFVLADEKAWDYYLTGQLPNHINPSKESQEISIDTLSEEVEKLAVQQERDTKPNPSQPKEKQQVLLKQPQQTLSAKLAQQASPAWLPLWKYPSDFVLRQGNADLVFFQQKLAHEVGTAWGLWNADRKDQAKLFIQPLNPTAYQSIEAPIYWVYGSGSPKAELTGQFEYENLGRQPGFHYYAHSRRQTATSIVSGMTVNFDQANLTDGSLDIDINHGMAMGGETWFVRFSGKIKDSIALPQVIQAKINDTRIAKGKITGFFTGPQGRLFLGAFFLFEAEEPSNRVHGIFLMSV